MLQILPENNLIFRKLLLHACQPVTKKKHLIQKKNADSNFDIAMGKFHGAEICELVGLFL